MKLTRLTVDAAARRVIADDRAIAYDMLVLATGATHGYFGHEEWAVYAPGLKSVPDATSIRSRILDAFEAESTEDAALQRKLLTFLICGAGPTGVEMAGAIAELAHNGMAKDFAISTPHPPGSFWSRPGHGCYRNSANDCRPSRAAHWKHSASRCTPIAGLS
jgi:NADH dehydrogenase FAD-containing subunit